MGPQNAQNVMVHLLPSWVKRHWESGPLLVLAALAMAIRAFRVSGAVLSNDEAFSWRLASDEWGALVQHAAADVHPPFYYFALKLWLTAWGPGPWALRGLSILLGAAAVVLVFVVCVEACVGGCTDPKATRLAKQGGLLAALLAAIHVSQVTPSRSARMYALGIFLAGASTWLLLRALRARRCPELWWTAYALAASAFILAHYYAFFTIAAQAIFTLGDLVRRAGGGSFREFHRSALGFAYACALIAVLFAPWLPVFRNQTRAVAAGFWVPNVTWSGTRRVFCAWSIGADIQSDRDQWVWLGFLAALVLWSLRWRARASWLFLLQAVLPWLLSLGISAWTGRPIFLERCLAFAHVSLLGFWCAAWCALPCVPARLVLAAWLIGPALAGLITVVAGWPVGPPALEEAAAALKMKYRVGDLVLTDSPAAVNRLRYYADKVGLPAANIRCPVSRIRMPGHITHIASLEPNDVTWSDSDPLWQHTRRVWRAREQDSPNPPPGRGWRLAYLADFTREPNCRWYLALYER